MAAVDAGARGAPAPRPRDVERFVHGMTVGTNALLEGDVARTALLATEGFTDLEELGRQARPELYRLCAGHPPPLVPAELRVAVPERSGPDGVLRELDEDELRAALAELDVEAVAVCLLWGFRHPEHERRAAELAARRWTACTSRPRTRPPASSASTSAARRRSSTPPLSPLLRRYLERLAERAARRRPARARDHAVERRRGRRRARPRGTARGRCCRARPAARWARRASPTAGAPDAVGLDMGGTSCDVSVLRGGRAARRRRARGRRPRARAADGRRAHGRRRRRLDRLARRGRRAARRARARRAPTRARPATAAAARSRRSPTPTCCSATSTPDSPLAGGVELDRDAAARGGRAARATSSAWRRARPPPGSRAWPAPRWRSAVRVVTVERGIDPRDLALRRLRRRRAAARRRDRRRARHAPRGRAARRRACCPRSAWSCPSAAATWSRACCWRGDELTREAVAEVVERLGERGREELGAPERRAARRLRPALRRPGVRADRSTARSSPTRPSCASAFDRAHEERYGYADADAELELVTVRVAAALPGAEPPAGRGGRRAARHAPARFDGEGVEAAVLGPGEAELDGPGDLRAARVDAGGAARLARARRRRRGGDGARDGLDPVTLQVMLGALRAACDEMGVVLVRSAHSANIKERRDASTALFDAARPDGHAGRAHPGAPRRDAVRGGGGARRGARSPATPGSSTTPTAAAPTCRTSPWSRRLPRRRAGRASPPAAPTTPTSAARARAACRPTRARSRTRAW